MYSRKKRWIIIGLILASALLGLYFYPQLPDPMVSHWGIYGEPNGTMPKFWAILVMPILSAFILLLFWAIPKIDPLASNIKKFSSYYDNFAVLIVGFLAYIQALMVLWNLGFLFSMTSFIGIGLGALFYYTGVFIENSKRSWFVGIRTPWTMSSDKVWDKTNRLGGKLFRAGGILTIIFGVLFGDYILVPVVYIIAVSIALVVYSYIEFRKSK